MQGQQIKQQQHDHHHQQQQATAHENSNQQRLVLTASQSLSTNSSNSGAPIIYEPYVWHIIQGVIRDLQFLCDQNYLSPIALAEIVNRLPKPQSFQAAQLPSSVSTQHIPAEKSPTSGSPILAQETLSNENSSSPPLQSDHLNHQTAPAEISNEDVKTVSPTDLHRALSLLDITTSSPSIESEKFMINEREDDYLESPDFPMPRVQYLSPVLNATNTIDDLEDDDTNQLKLQTPVRETLNSSDMEPTGLNPLTGPSNRPLPVLPITGANGQSSSGLSTQKALRKMSKHEEAAFYAQQDQERERRERAEAADLSYCLCTVEALWDLNGVDEDDLSFKKGDIIDVTQYVNADWWYGTNRAQGSSGIFPKIYINVLSTNQRMNSAGTGYFTLATQSPIHPNISEQPRPHLQSFQSLSSSSSGSHVLPSSAQSYLLATQLAQHSTGSSNSSHIYQAPQNGIAVNPAIQGGQGFYSQFSPSGSVPILSPVELNVVGRPHYNIPMYLPSLQVNNPNIQRTSDKKE
ncbi:hypothetical protein G9A89_002645 [Geosiphon pyriformis]|nr:hypothetical protein G9A89_002645 [Geosiphon pyriformis]